MLLAVTCKQQPNIAYPIDLAEHLGGLQHAPLLLVSNTQEDIKALHLDRYSLNGSESLRALKGHLINLFAEIPFLLSPTLKQEVDQVIAVCLWKHKITGTDLCVTAIVFSQLLAGRGVSMEIQALMDTIVCIAQVSYLLENKRTSRTVLQLYNCTWYHHELLQHLVPHPNILTHKKLFGSNLHDISCHEGPQFELVSL